MDANGWPMLRVGLSEALAAWRSPLQRVEIGRKVFDPPWFDDQVRHCLVRRVKHNIECHQRHARHIGNHVKRRRLGIG